MTAAKQQQQDGQQDAITEAQDAPTTLSAADVAEALGTDAKTFRRFVRASVRAQGGSVGTDTPGSRGRYAFSSADVPALGEAFEAWRAMGGGGGVKLVGLAALGIKPQDAPDEA